MNAKQLQFVREYLVDMNGTQAAIRAGYSKVGARVQANRLLTNVDVRAAIAKMADKRAKKTEVTQEQVVVELRKIAFSRKTTAHKVRALELLGKHLCMFTDVMRHEGDLPVMVVKRDPDG